MSDTPAQPPVNGAPVLRVLNQYLKDLSFESPMAPQSLRTDLAAPQIEVSVDVNARRLAEDQYECELAINVSAKRDDQTAFVVEVNYAGHLLIQNLPEDQLQMALLIEAPRLLFPFARQVVSNATRDGGFMPLMLEPLDFAAMYQMQMQQRAQGAPEGGNA